LNESQWEELIIGAENGESTHGAWWKLRLEDNVYFLKAFYGCGLFGDAFHVMESVVGNQEFVPHGEVVFIEPLFSQIYVRRWVHCTAETISREIALKIQPQMVLDEIRQALAALEELKVDLGYLKLSNILIDCVGDTIEVKLDNVSTAVLQCLAKAYLEATQEDFAIGSEYFPLEAFGDFEEALKQAWK
jgi:hypothetical protein